MFDKITRRGLIGLGCTRFLCGSENVYVLVCVRVRKHKHIITYTR